MLMQIIHHFSRFFVGGFFIFSGLVKLNDPMGTKIKMEEYFQVFSTDFAAFFEWFIPLALPIGMLVIILEIVLGVAVLIYYRMSSTTWVLLGLTVFFGFLTFYSAYFNKVTDCGCFGDAIPLTPWQSFYKDVILMAFILHLFWHRRKYTPVFRTLTGHIVVLSVIMMSLFVGYYAIQHLPYVDFRPYKIGNNIPQQMIAEEQPIIEYIFTKDGQEVRSQQYLMPDQGYEYIDSHVLNEDKTIPKITDYQVVGVDGEDYTEQTFQGAVLMLIFYDAEPSGLGGMRKINHLVDEVNTKATPMVLTSANEQEFERFRHEHQLAVPYYFTDATVLKAMIRSNPGIMLLRNGTVLGKWHHHDVPSAEDILALLS